MQQGGVIRRKVRGVKRFAGMDAFLGEVHRYGYQVTENAGQLIIFCNRQPVRSLASGEGSKSLKDFEPRPALAARR